MARMAEERSMGTRPRRKDTRRVGRSEAWQQYYVQLNRNRRPDERKAWPGRSEINYFYPERIS